MKTKLHRSFLLLLALMLMALPIQPARASADASAMPEGLFEAMLETTASSFETRGNDHLAHSGGLDISLNAAGLQAGNGNGLSWGIALNGFGRGEQISAVAEAETAQTGNGLEYRRGALTEWYRDTAFGLEQGFTIHESPGGRGEIVIQLDLSTDLEGALDEDGRGLSFAGKDGQTLRYDHLKAFDANGAELDARMIYQGGRVLIQVDDRGAAYPLTIDPLIYLEQKVLAYDGAGDDRFGSFVALSGDTALVSAYSDDIGGNADQGSAYIFTKSGGAWVFTAKLTASDGAADDRFGSFVALSGDTALVGAYWDDIGGNADQGSAYVFVRPGGGWATGTETAKLTASDGAADDRFGLSVALSGDTALVGAYSDDIGGNANQGSAYVFVKPGGGWATGTETAKLTASDGAADDGFGYSVAISGDTALAGAFWDDIGGNADQGSAYVFVKPGGGWATGTETAKLTASDGAASDFFGVAVALSGDTALVGAYSDDIGANTAQGSAYVFVKPGGGWATGAETAKLTASDGAASDGFGNSVVLSGDTALVGARLDDVGANADQGSAYVFVKPGGGWATGTETAKLTASDGAASDYFGWSVALSGDTALVGARLDDVGGNADQGSAYFYQAYRTDNDLAVSAGINSSGPFQPGDTVYLTTSVMNYGPTAASNVLLDASLPSGLTYASNVLTHGSYDTTTGSWDVGTLAMGVSATLIIEATVDPIPPQILTFTASTIGTDTNNSNNSASVALAVIPFTTTFNSQGASDGWVLESTETSNVGGTMNNTATTFFVGDNAADKQYRAILSFYTATLPDTAVITKVTLKIKQYGAPTGTNPFTTHGLLYFDIKTGAFSSNGALQLGDFQAAPSKAVAGAIPNAPVNGWYSKVWNANIFSYINKTGVTQFRLRFQKDDNDDLGADYLAFLSGNAGTVSYRPTLIIEYYVP